MLWLSYLLCYISLLSGYSTRRLRWNLKKSLLEKLHEACLQRVESDDLSTYRLNHYHLWSIFQIRELKEYINRKRNDDEHNNQQGATTFSEHIFILQCKTWFFEASICLVNIHLEWDVWWPHFSELVVQKMDQWGW